MEFDEDGRVIGGAAKPAAREAASKSYSYAAADGPAGVLEVQARWMEGLASTAAARGAAKEAAAKAGDAYLDAADLPTSSDDEDETSEDEDGGRRTEEERVVQSLEEIIL